MHVFQITIICTVFAGQSASVLGTLAQSKSIAEQQTPRLNKIGKLILKDKEVEVIVTLPPPVTSTTTKSVKAGKNDYDPVEVSVRSHKAIELAIVTGGVTILLLILAAAVRTCYYVYKKVKTFTSPPSASVVYRNSPHPSHPIPPQQIGSPLPGQNIYTVMPGHFVIQPYFASRPGPPIVGDVDGSHSRHVPFSPGPSSRSEADESACIVTVIRPETPPPPYPGTEK